MIGSSEHPALTFGFPPDAAAWAALVLGIVCLFFPRWRLLGKTAALSLERATFLLLSLCVVSFCLSWGYFYFYLNGAPRIIDATTYLLEARSFASGSFSFEVPEPTASFRGRFLIHTAHDPQRLAAIFPPGYPTVLALGVRLGAPFFIGPLLAALLAAVTYFLALELTGRRHISLLAATFSTFSACLRYHTSETMSHGLASVLAAGALLYAVRLLKTPRSLNSLYLGLSLGLLIATRQLTGVIFGLVAIFCLLLDKSSRSHKSFLYTALGLFPGLALLAAHHYAITGDLLVSPQTRYYALADGPPGCFGLGLGKGCSYEHADVVAQQGGHGLTLGWAALNTLHRLHYHLLDIAHFEPLVLVALYALWIKRHERGLRLLSLSLIAIPLGYSLFYFSGSYPGGGARFFVELIPIWHVLLAWGLTELSLQRLGLVTTLAGFAIHASYGHRALKNPHFGPDGSQVRAIPGVLEHAFALDSQARSQKALVLFDTAHEFNLAYGSDDSFVAARRTNDSRQQLLHDYLAASRSFFYRNGDDGPWLQPLDALPEMAAHRTFSFEAEFDYPPRAQQNIWVHPEHLPAQCVSGGRALALHPTGPAPRLSLEASGVPPGAYDVDVHAVEDSDHCVTFHLGRLPLPGVIQLDPTGLRNLSHIDRLQLTLPHP